MAVVTMKQLLEAGVHLNQTLKRIEVAYSYVRDLVAGNGTVLFVGTKKQTQDAISSYADECGMPYVNERWLGGMLTNFAAISGRVKKMQEYERMKAAGDFDAMPKKEALILGRELDKLQRNLGGIRTMTRLPDAIFVIDTKKEHIAVTEANKLGLPILAVVDTNCDPDVIQYVIPGNDDAIRAGTLMCRILSDAVKEGKGLVVYHHASSAFVGGDDYSKEFEKVIAGGWRKQGNHGKRHEFSVTIRNHDHPITKGMPAEFAHANDELYANSVMFPDSAPGDAAPATGADGESSEGTTTSTAAPSAAAPAEAREQ